MKEEQRTSHMRFNTVDVSPIRASSVQYVNKIKNTWNKKIIYNIGLLYIKKERKKKITNNKNLKN